MVKKQELTAMKDRWELKKGRTTWVASPIPYCGYNEQTKASLKKKGFRFFCNGKATD